MVFGLLGKLCRLLKLVGSVVVLELVVKVRVVLSDCFVICK